MTKAWPDVVGWQLDLCDMEGHLLELAWRRGYDMREFVPAFMGSEVAAGLDSSHSRYQWLGEGYALSHVVRSCGLFPDCKPDGTDPEALYWMGYTYRYWHYLTGETSREIYAVADFRRMKTVYAGYHTLSCEKAVEWLKRVA